MKVVSTGNTYRIYDNSLKTHDQLPAMVYSLRFNKMTGFFLETHSAFDTHEPKIYGVHTEKVNKVIRTFKDFTRSLGIILSGDKGIGKSLFAKLLSNELVDEGYPVIIVDQSYPGISAFIEELEQEVVILFDEFDKTFSNNEDGCGAQAELLSLFDGTAVGKKLYIITCNEVRKLNDYLVNRPGRFHYHFRFDYPTAEEIREYLSDKLSEQYHAEIAKVITFAKKVNINYDCLRAIAIELEYGEPFEQAILDMNIIRENYCERYNFSLHYSDGSILTARRVSIDMFDSEESEVVWLDAPDCESVVSVEFAPTDAQYDAKEDNFFIAPAALMLSYSERKACESYAEQLKAVSPTGMFMTRCARQGIHYNV